MRVHSPRRLNARAPRESHRVGETNALLIGFCDKSASYRVCREGTLKTCCLAACQHDVPHGRRREGFSHMVATQDPPKIRSFTDTRRLNPSRQGETTGRSDDRLVVLRPVCARLVGLAIGQL